MISGDEMAGSESESQYAHHGSRRRVNADLNIHTIFPIDGDGWKDWDQFDLVFFQGHVTMITWTVVGQTPFNSPFNSVQMLPQEISCYDKVLPSLHCWVRSEQPWDEELPFVLGTNGNLG